MITNAERLTTILDRTTTMVEDLGDELRRANVDLHRVRRDVDATKTVLASLMRDEIAISGRLPDLLRDEHAMAMTEGSEDDVWRDPRDIEIEMETIVAIDRIVGAPEHIDRMMAGLAGPGADLSRSVAGFLLRRVEDRHSIDQRSELAYARKHACVRIAGRAAYLRGNGTMPSEDVLAGPVSEWERMLDAIEASTTMDEVKAIHEEIQDMVVVGPDRRAAPGGFGM